MPENRNSLRERNKDRMRKNVMEGKGKRVIIPPAIRDAMPYIGFGALIASGVILVFVLGFTLYRHYRTYSTYKVAWSVDSSTSESTELLIWGEGLLQIDKNGAGFYDKTGKAVWAASYDMQNPVTASQGNYLLIYDSGGQSMIICDLEGKTGNITTVYSIYKADISSSGVVAAVVGDSSAVSSYIYYYRKNGEQLDVNIRTSLALTGYPMDIALSPSGQQLAVSYYAIGAGKGISRVDFYDFEKGDEENDRIIASFDYEESDTYIPFITYNGSARCFSVGDNQLSFYTISEQNAVTEKTVPFSGKLQRVFYNEKYLGLVVMEGSDLTLLIYSMSGKKVKEISQDMLFENYCFDGKQIVMYNDTLCRIQTFNGRERFEMSFANGIDAMIPLGNKRDLYIATKNMIQKISLR